MRSRTLQFDIRSQTATAADLRRYLESQPAWDSHGVELKVRTLRSIEPSVLVALVGGASAGLGALITGLLQMAKQSAAKTIVFQGQSFRIEVPADTTPEELDELIQRLKKLDEDSVAIAMT